MSGLVYIGSLNCMWYWYYANLCLLLQDEVVHVAVHGLPF